MARVVKKGTYRYKIFRALNILVRLKKKNCAYTEKENIPFFLFLSVRASEGGRVARVVKKGTHRYKIFRALTERKRKYQNKYFKGGRVACVC